MGRELGPYHSSSGQKGEKTLEERGERKKYYIEKGRGEKG